MNSYFMQREGGRLYGIAKMGQQEYGEVFVLNGEKSSVTDANISRITCEVCVKVV
jgi:hypothetical protein